MSGSNNNASCPKCGVVNPLRGKAMTVALTCTACKTYFRLGEWNQDTVEFSFNAIPDLAIGSKGRFDNFLYEVLGFAVKEENRYHFKWREYMLFNPYRGYAFLSEYNGHWNFIWPIEDNPRPRVSNLSFKYEGSDYQLFQRYSAKVVHAQGEFFFDVFNTTEHSENFEYISPPFLLALERSRDTMLWCKGEYLTPREIAKAFSIPKSKLPYREGVGYTQPINTSFTDQALFRLTTLLVLVTFAIHLIINFSSAEKMVLRADYRQSDLNDQKMIVTPSFVLDDGTKSLEVILHAPVDNDWFFGEFTLVNETDGTEYNFTKEVQYYHGTDGGESWSEGSRNAEAFLSGIPEGRYHLNIYPQFSPVNQAFSVQVTRDVPMQINFTLTALALIAFPVFHYIRKRQFEQSRWSESDFSTLRTH